MATNAPQDDWHKTGLRLPKELHHQLHEAAAASGRSYNAEIVARLEASFDAKTDSGMTHKLIDQLERQELTIATLTSLAHTLALTGGEKRDDLVVAAILLKNIESRPDSLEDRERLISALAVALQKVEKPTSGTSRRTSSKKPSGH